LSELSPKKAKQIQTALTRGAVKTPSYKPAFLEDPKYLATLRVFCVRAVHQIWAKERRPTKNRHEIVSIVQNMVRENIFGEWDSWWGVPSSDNIVRRLNETADETVWGGATPCIAVTAGEYMPNPHKWDEPLKSQMLAVLEAMKK
jgi:hypothetical protein